LNTAIGQIGGSAVQLSNRSKIYLRKLKQLHGATSRADVQRFEALKAMFTKYGDQYGFDDLLLQAQGYQESRLNQNARSYVGAVGLMQLMPATGASMKVGDIHQADPNVHAGTRYMRLLIDRYFPDAKFDRQNRTLFAFAAYNAGPGAIARMRKIAVQEKLDPDLWFDNVERVTAARIGQEPVRYVRNIYKYYIAYRLLEERRQSIHALQQRTQSSK
jgi:membrane-bound lytic murein transglycosylase MltF